MPLDPKPLFRPEALRSHLATFELPSTTALARTKLNHWSILLGTPKAGTLKETELRDEFIYDVFRDLLGYVSAVQDSSAFTLKKEKLIEVDGTFADAAFGKFDEWNGPTAI